MSDHLDFIRIAGLESAETEVFQGLLGSAAGSDVNVSGGGETTSLEWGTIPAEVLQDIATYFQDLKTWLSSKPFDPSLTRGLTDALKPSVPVIAGAVATAATGGTVALPAIASALVTQVGMNLIDGMLEQALERVDPNPLQEAFETAFLTVDNQSILQTGLQQLHGILDQRLSDLAYVDKTVDFGFARVHIKGKMIEY
jgi:hypothetical protein